MIKKINIILVVVAILGGLYFAITNDKGIIFALKDTSIIITISALYIIQKVFKFKISESINLIYIIFVFMAHFLGVTVNLYDKIYWYDKFVHFISGIVTGLASIYVLVKSKSNRNIVFSVLFIVSFSMLIATLWEIFEFSMARYFYVDPQRVLLTGVNDTMGDIIVALIGSILVSVCYFWENKTKNNGLIKKYENQIK